MAFSPERLVSALERDLEVADRPTGLCVALSGGLDSSVLLAALCGRHWPGGRLPLRAIHVDHGLHPDSAAWGGHCAQLCASLEAALEQVRVDARPAAGESPEAAAREARYAALAGRLGEREVLLTAHHADDQLETVLLQWLRGGGLRAVAGMPAIAPFGRGWHARPLLEFSRDELRAWAETVGLGWLEDPSNVDTRFDRNYLRLEVLPAILGRWPAAARTVGRVAAQAAETLEIEAAAVAVDYAAVRDGGTLSAARLASLPEPRQRRVLRAWLRDRFLPVPSAATLRALLADTAKAAPDRVPCVDWPGARVYRYRGRLFAVAGQAPESLREGSWMPGTSFDLGTFGRLDLQPSTGAGLSRERLPESLEVVHRPQGGRFRPAGAAYQRPLRKWFQEQGVLPWQRGALPLLEAGGEIVAIGDLAYGGALAAAPGEPSWIVAWSGRPVLTEAEAVGVPTPA